MLCCVSCVQMPYMRESDLGAIFAGAQNRPAEELVTALRKVSSGLIHQAQQEAGSLAGGNVSSTGRHSAGKFSASTSVSNWELHNQQQLGSTEQLPASANVGPYILAFSTQIHSLSVTARTAEVTNAAQLKQCCRLNAGQPFAQVRQTW